MHAVTLLQRALLLTSRNFSAKVKTAIPTDTLKPKDNA
jgi:hypothetical protein